MGSGPNERGASRKHIEDSIAASLQKLQTGYIDLYQVNHAHPCLAHNGLLVVLSLVLTLAWPLCCRFTRGWTRRR